MIVYISIGNSDDKLAQAEWVMFQRDVRFAIVNAQVVAAVHGDWVSHAGDPYQNACWCIELRDSWTASREGLRDDLRDLARRYRQDSIAWAEAPVTELLSKAAWS
jgi:hypothetical protein